MISSEKRGREPRREMLAVALALALALLAWAGPCEAGGRGASLKLIGKDGTVVDGELIGVRGSTLILREDSSEKDLSLGLADLNQVMVKNDARVAAGFGLGLLGFAAGGTAGVFAGRASTARGSGFMAGFGQGIAGAEGGIIGGVLGCLAGVGIGLSVTKPERYSISGMDDAARETLLAKLRAKARFPKYD